MSPGSGDCNLNHSPSSPSTAKVDSLIGSPQRNRLPLPPSANIQVIPQGVAPSPCIPCCLVITEDRLFTCHEDCQTSFFRSLGTARLADISAISTELGKEYCILVSWVGTRAQAPPKEIHACSPRACCL